MARWTTKGEPNRVTNWLGSLRYEPGDQLRLVRVAGIGTVGAETVTSWAGKQLTAGQGVDNFAETILTIAQDHCDALESRQEYRLELVRTLATEAVEATFTLRLEPSDVSRALQYDDEDPTIGGQIKQQMAFTRQMLHFAMRAPMASMDQLARQLDIAYARIATLESERAAMLDTYAEALSLLAEVQAAKEPGETTTQKLQGVLALVPTMVQGVKALSSGMQAITKVG